MLILDCLPQDPFMRVYEHHVNDASHKSAKTYAKEAAGDERSVHPMDMTEVTGERTARQ